MCLFTCSRRPPLLIQPRRAGGAAEDPMRWQRWAPRSRGPLVPQRPSGPSLSSPADPTHPGPPAAALLQSSSPNLLLPPPPAHWPHAGCVTPGPAPIHRGLRAVIPPHPPADCQPIRREPRQGSPNPPRKSQWQRKTRAAGERGGELGGPASVGV